MFKSWQAHLKIWFENDCIIQCPSFNTILTVLNGGILSHLVLHFMSRGDGMTVKLLLKVLANDTILFLTLHGRHEFHSNPVLVEVF